MKKLLLLTSILFGLLFSAETVLGELSLGEPYQIATEKSPLLPPWGKLEEVNRPYPMYLQDESSVWLGQSNKMDMLFYCTMDKKITAIAAYFNEKEKSAAYETSAGLRCGDGPIEMNLLYGDPLGVSEYAYKDENNLETIRKIYYYPNLCIHTKSQEGLPEFIESIVLANYDIQYVLNKKNEPLRKNRI
jgi:hypothetical protein